MRITIFSVGVSREPLHYDLIYFWFRMFGLSGMLLPQCHESVIAFDEVGNNNVPVTVTVCVDYAENGIRLVLRKDGHNRVIYKI